MRTKEEDRDQIAFIVDQYQKSFHDILGNATFAFFSYHSETEAKGGEDPFVIDGRVTLS